MIAQVKLADIIDALESVSMDNRTFVNLKSGEIYRTHYKRKQMVRNSREECYS